MHDNQHFAILITHTGQADGIVAMRWLETEYHIDQSDWMVLSPDGWRAVADGDPVIWDALERKLLVGFYVSQPQMIVVIGHPSGEDDDVEQRQEEVRRIVERIRSLLLPVGVMGIWTDESGNLQDVLTTAECGELQPAH